MSSRLRWIVSATAALVIFGLLLVAAVVLLRRIDSSFTLLNHTHDVRVEIERSLLALDDAETGERGFLLTAEEDYLEPYNRALVDVPESLDRLRTLSHDNAEQQRRVDEIARLAAARLGELEAAITARRRQGSAAAVAIVRGGAGKRTMDAIRRLYAEMQAAEDRSLEARSETASRGIQVTTLVVLSSSLVLAVVVASALGLRRADRQRERTRALEREREASERVRLGLVIDAAPAGMIMVDRQGRIVLVNATSEKLFGYTREELTGKPIEILLPERFRGGHPDFRTGFFKDPGPRQMGAGRELYGLRKDGSDVPVEIGLSVVELAEGPCAVAAITDISERRREDVRRRFLEDASAALVSPLEAKESTLPAVTRLAVPYLADWCAVDLLDPDGTVRSAAVVHVDAEKVAWAQALRTRYPPDPIAPVGLHHVLATGVAEMAEISDSLLEQSAVDEEHLRILRSLGMCSYMVVPLISQGRTLGAISFVAAESKRRYGPADLALARELCDRAALALHNASLFAAEQQVRAEAERAVRMREAILGVVSHDLRNPLTTVTMKATMIDRLAAADDTGERIRKQASGIVGSVEQMTRMVQDLLDLAKIESGQLLAIEPERRSGTWLVQQAVESLQPLASARKVTLDTDPVPNGCELRCDGDRILQVLSNLIGNAIKFTREGGSITVRSRRSDGEILFSVTDTGTGIPEDQIPYIFEPYWQATADRRGIGLGLSIANAIVQAHRGRIWVETEVGHGSTFHFALPALEAAEDTDDRG